MLELAAERGGNVDDPHKRDPLDFVLWQPSLADEPAWDSLWGPGRPGWHIECSALAMRELGLTIDLHGGGTDLIFPHHECEVAQSEAATGETFVRHWMHVGMVRLDGEKMAKSLGNLVFVGDLLPAHEPAVAPARPHSPTTTAPSSTGRSGSSTRRTAASPPGAAPDRGAAALDEVRARLDDDLDTPGALRRDRRRGPGRARRLAGGGARSAWRL